MGMKATIDPLGDVSLLWLREKGKHLCDCPARMDSRMKHSSLCNSSREYAALCLEGTDPDMLKSELLSARIGKPTGRWLFN